MSTQLCMVETVTEHLTCEAAVQEGKINIHGTQGKRYKIVQDIIKN
jgi:hypothetical protein